MLRKSIIFSISKTICERFSRRVIGLRVALVCVEGAFCSQVAQRSLHLRSSLVASDSRVARLQFARRRIYESYKAAARALKLAQTASLSSCRGVAVQAKQRSNGKRAAGKHAVVKSSLRLVAQQTQEERVKFVSQLSSIRRAAKAAICAAKLCTRNARRKLRKQTSK